MIEMIGRRLDTLSSINHHLGPVDKPALVTREIQAHIRHIAWLGQPAQGNVPKKLGAVFRRIFHAGEHREQSSPRQERGDGVDPDIVWSIFGC